MGMQVLIVAATENEISPLREKLERQINADKYYHRDLVVEILITGVGMTATAFALGKHLVNKNYDLAVNVGLAGAFDRNLKLTQVVEIITDCFPELGAESGQQFLSLTDLQLQAASVFPFEKEKVKTNFPEEMLLNKSWEMVHGITVNTVHGDEESIAKVQNAFQPQVESMEGAAFFYACRMMDIPSIQLRAISNYVEKRNKAAWRIKESIAELTKESLFLLNEI